MTGEKLYKNLEHLDFNGMEYLLVLIGILLVVAFTFRFVWCRLQGKKVSFKKWIKDVLDALWGMG